MKKYKQTQQIGIISFSLSYVLMILGFLISEHGPFLFMISWILGIGSYLSNVRLSIGLRMPKLISLVLIITGLFWVIPPMALMTYFGIPFSITFLLLVPVVHIRYHNKWENYQLENKIWKS